MTKDELFIIDAHHLSKSFLNKVAVYDFSLQAKKGEIIGFLGPNGSGKTTSIRMLCGLLKPDSGYGTCMGFDFNKDNEKIRSQIGYMTQRFSLYPYLTIRENLVFISKAFNLNDPDERINFIINKLGLTHRQNQRAGTLSGGWKQRIALACAILHEPSVLLLDEPTAGVDPQERQKFWRIINELAHSGVTILVSTHYMDEIERCNRLLYLAYGKLILSGYIDEIITSSSLRSWEVDNIEKNQHALITLLAELEKLDAVSHVIPFGSKLMVTGKKTTELNEQLQPHLKNKKFRWQEVPPGIEDIIINLGENLKDDRFD